MTEYVNTNETLKIPLSKGKLVLLLAGALLFVILGLWFIKQPEIFRKGVALIIVIGYAAVIFFGISAIFIFRKLFDTKAGIILDDKGIHDNSGGVSAGFIPWGNITNISTIEVSRQKLIMIEVSTPDDYINRQTNYIAKKAAAINHKMYGSPISITATSLKYSFDDLYYTLRKRWQQNISASEL
ncbi:STM3941 family protein [Mucilaginibacter aquariorum]|uniref:Band 7 domain-containing protein n=1 Tax=Mucilaginibacter aquariorum TaxID=2967225 RepID=A0ABT1T286_9SPHI|nr:STM3941 family protein [Mucilaginibacter aquariorum]MCQ6958520.1 hypothetical protein [Mucilaginibacter aquariorum]